MGSQEGARAPRGEHGASVSREAPGGGGVEARVGQTGETCRKISSASNRRFPITKSYAAHEQPSRETVESIVVAVILAFLFRAFVAEAFVIPTGSMASTLMGRHIDVTCNECGFRYSCGASSENPGDNPALKVFIIIYDRLYDGM